LGVPEDDVVEIADGAQVFIDSCALTLLEDGLEIADPLSGKVRIEVIVTDIV
jgi:hypothetical protein